MKINYVDNTKEVLTKIFDDRIDEFELSIQNACEKDKIEEIGVHSLTPGLSGAAVFQINRIKNSAELTPWIAKADKNIKLIQQEKDNWNEYIKEFMSDAPKLVYSDARVLYYEYAGFLANYEPVTLRYGYSKTSPEKLRVLMENIGKSLERIQRMHPDSLYLTDRMPELDDICILKANLRETKLPFDRINVLISAWNNIKLNKTKYPKLRSKAHGDLNSGNVLHQPGESYPVIIDFASMKNSNDNKKYDDYYHYPFWDYAKLERDIITRLFLNEAVEENISNDDIIDIVKYICGNRQELSSCNKTKKAAEKLLKTLSALRSTRNHYFPESYQKCYKVVLAYSLTKMLFRKVPDSKYREDIDIQGLVAVNAAITLLSEPFESLTDLTDEQNSKPTKEDLFQIVKDDSYPLEQRLAALDKLRIIDSKDNVADTFKNLNHFLCSYSSKHNRMQLNDIRKTGAESPADAYVSFQMLRATSRTLQRIASNMIPPWGSPNGFTIPILTLESYFEKSSLILSIKNTNIEAWHLPLPSEDQKLELVLIRGNYYPVGSPEYEKFRDTTYNSRSTGSHHPECLRHKRVPTFAISRYPISQAQWDCVKFSIEFPNRKLNSKNPLLPMHNIKKEEALTWCNKLDNYLKEQKILTETARVSLPTNEQWEIACRAGNHNRIYSFGRLLLPEYANFNPDIDTIESNLKFAPDIQLRESGFYGFCNDWGLSDMHGNVFEWCHALEPDYDVARGGSFRCESGFCRSAYQKIIDDKNYFSDDIGFRICLNLD